MPAPPRLEGLPLKLVTPPVGDLKGKPVGRSFTAALLPVNDYPLRVTSDLVSRYNARHGQTFIAILANFVFVVFSGWKVSRVCDSPPK